jgi:hypothetical protein
MDVYGQGDAGGKVEANEKVGTVVLKLLRSSASPANFLFGSRWE